MRGPTDIESQGNQQQRVPPEPIRHLVLQWELYDIRFIRTPDFTTLFYRQIEYHVREVTDADRAGDLVVERALGNDNATPSLGEALAQPPRETLSTHVERGIREALMAGRFLPGERLNIRALAKMLGTSATPVREALSRLAAEGAVELVPNQSVRVPVFSRERFEELKLIRMAVEGLAAEQSVLSITPGEIAAVEGSMTQYIAAAHANRSDRSLALSKQFRFGIYAAARMPTLLRVIEGLWARSAPSFRFMYPSSPVDLELEGAYADAVEGLKRRDAGLTRRSIEHAIAIGTDRLQANHPDA
jgi:GntR family colanic acid and biofilm gene transcriptional regulator